MKQRMKKQLLYFFIFMIMTNVACRVRDTYMVPRVVTTRPIRTELTHSLQAEGYFTSSDKEYVQPKAEWKIGRVFVKVGTQVEEQDALWQYDLEYLQDLLLNKKGDLKKQQIAIEQTKMTYASESKISSETLALQDFEQATEQVACEQIWLEEAVVEYEKKIKEINQKYDKKENLARQEYDISCSAELDDMQRALLDTKLASQIQELKESRKQEKESAYDKIISQNKNLFQAIQDFESAKQNYDNAVVTQNEAQEQRNRSNNSVTLTISALEIEEKHLTEEIAYIEEYIQNEGYVYAKKAGNITNIDLIEGHKTGGEEKVEIAGKANTFTFSLPETETALIEKGDECYIHVAGMSGSKAGKIECLQPENQGEWTITCIQSGEEAWDDYRWNQQGTVSISKKTQDYNCCIPIEALVCQNEAYYCRVVTKEQTILGTEEIIEEIPVTLIDKDATYACVTGDINEESKVVTDYNKAITDGDRVRVVRKL